MSRWHLERAVYLLGHEGPQTKPYDTPGAALDALIEEVRLLNEADNTYMYPPFELEPEEIRLIAESDLAEMYRGGLHPNLIRAFAGAWGIDYVATYRAAGL